MIQSLTLRNFKSIKDHKFHLRNLNVVMGINGMGKSTFIQSLLLLRQSENLNKGILTLNDDLVKIGKGKDAFYQYSQDDEIVFDIEFKDHVDHKFKFNYSREADFFSAKDETNIDSRFFSQSIFNKNFQYLNANRLEPKVLHEKSYSSVISDKDLGINGQYAVHYLNQYGSDDVAFDNLIHHKSEISTIEGVERVNKTLLSQVNNWLGEISPGVKLGTLEIGESDNIMLDFRYAQPNRGFTNNFRPTNVGFGISYALPVITSLLAATPNKLIIIENPESHIHPRGQVELGRLIALTAMNDVQIIVETHSDHIFNGIRVAVKENIISHDKVMTFYFEKQVEENEQYSKITDVEIDRNGELNKYPSNMLDEWSNQLFKLI